MEPSIGFFGSLVRGRSWRRSSLAQFGRRLKGRSLRTRRRGHESFKAICKIGDTGSASGAVTLSIWLTGQPCNLGRVGGGVADGISCSFCCLFRDCPVGRNRLAERGGVGPHEVQTRSRHPFISNGKEIRTPRLRGVQKSLSERSLTTKAY
jgi:hypothetical protein